MSGGFFDYEQDKLITMADGLDEIIRRHTVNTEEFDLFERFSEKTLDELRKTAGLLRHTYVYAQRADWLISDDDGEESFHRRLSEELSKLPDDNSYVDWFDFLKTAEPLIGKYFYHEKDDECFLLQGLLFGEEDFFYELVSTDNQHKVKHVASSITLEQAGLRLAARGEL